MNHGMKKMTAEQQLKNFVWYLLDHDRDIDDLYEQGESKYSIVNSIAWRARVVFGQHTFDKGEMNLIIEHAFDYWVADLGFEEA